MYTHVVSACFSQTSANGWIKTCFPRYLFGKEKHHDLSGRIPVCPRIGYPQILCWIPCFSYEHCHILVIISHCLDRPIVGYSCTYEDRLHTCEGDQPVCISIYPNLSCFWHLGDWGGLILALQMVRLMGHAFCGSLMIFYSTSGSRIQTAGLKKTNSSNISSIWGGGPCRAGWFFRWF